MDVEKPDDIANAQILIFPGVRVRSWARAQMPSGGQNKQKTRTVHGREEHMLTDSLCVSFSSCTGVGSFGVCMDNLHKKVRLGLHRARVVHLCFPRPDVKPSM